MSSGHSARARANVMTQRAWTSGASLRRVRARRERRAATASSGRPAPSPASAALVSAMDRPETVSARSASVPGSPGGSPQERLRLLVAGHGGHVVAGTAESPGEDPQPTGDQRTVGLAVGLDERAGERHGFTGVRHGRLHVVRVLLTSTQVGEEAGQLLFGMRGAPGCGHGAFRVRQGHEAVAASRVAVGQVVQDVGEQSREGLRAVGREARVQVGQLREDAQLVVVRLLFGEHDGPAAQRLGEPLGLVGESTGLGDRLVGARARGDESTRGSVAVGQVREMPDAQRQHEPGVEPRAHPVDLVPRLGTQRQGVLVPAEGPQSAGQLDEYLGP